jgi:hypothetical protein
VYLVARATRKLPGPTNLFSEEDNQTGKSVAWVMQEKMYQVIRFCPPGTTVVQMSEVLSTEGTCSMMYSLIKANSSTALQHIYLTYSSSHIQGAECCEQQSCFPHNHMWDHSRSHISPSTCNGARRRFHSHSSSQQTQSQTHLGPQLADAWRITQSAQCSSKLKIQSFNAL